MSLNFPLSLFLSNKELKKEKGEEEAKRDGAA